YLAIRLLVVIEIPLDVLLSFCYDYPQARYLHSFPPRRSSDLTPPSWPAPCRSRPSPGCPASWKRSTPATCWPSTAGPAWSTTIRSEEHTSELQSPYDLVCRLLLEKKNSCSRLSLTALTRSITL